jgi:[glutamine synthetase] adenylyltransferase / [glutamine synthetase]-adenylyl-L-tyrosine phosphorylase
MNNQNFLGAINTLPAAANPDQAAQCHEDFINAVHSLKGDPETQPAIPERLENLLDHPTAARLLASLFGNSPFLTWCVLSEPLFTLNLIADGPDAAYDSIFKILDQTRKETLNNAQTARILRVARRQVALSIAVGDICGLWTLEKVTHAISTFADKSLSLAAAQVLRQAANDGAFELAHDDDPERDSGFVILGMGKLGARELNYSSDIDLIILFNPDCIKTDQPDRLQKNFIRLTRNLVKLIDERTADGYVFRTDLRLRPDPGATPIAMSTYAAETYYESIGQNWERAAMIKARAVAGDLEAGERFLKWLTPFIWRKNLDFAAIQDIHSIKRQINAHKGGEAMDVPGHNIKLGRGGIREVEFFAQTQQLIWGGREPGLRSSITLTALKALADFGLCEVSTADEMGQSYEYLRTLEHRLQMTNDEQTQTLPSTEDGLRQLATFMGYDDLNTFTTDVQHHLLQVQGHYGLLFADSPALSADRETGGNLVFTGSDSDPDTLRTIENLGYGNPQTVDATVRGWHHGRYRSVRSTRAREILTELMPTLLGAIGATPDPDSTFLRFDEFLRGLPAGVQLFSMFQTHPRLLNLVAEIMGKAPRLARHLAGRPSVLDGVLTPDFFDPPPNHMMMTEELSRLLSRAEYEEDLLNISRRWAHDRRFQVGVQRLQGLIDAATASIALSNIAETALACLYPCIEEEFARKHGRVEGASMAILALGKLGSREMTASSDLDLVFVYVAPDPSSASDGEKPLYVPQFFARLSQRYINALTAMTPEGSLYEVDMRLRPSGNSGPIATTLEAFEKYQSETAWTWEHMALTRARTVAGDDGLRKQTEGTVRKILCRQQDAESLLRDVSNMRGRLVREKPADGLWSLKKIRGGIVDIEFIAQYLILLHAQSKPDIMSTNTTDALRALGREGVLSADDATQLVDTLRLWHGLQGMLSLTVEEEMTAAREAEMSDALKASLAAIGETSSFEQLEDKVRALADQIYGIFKRLIEEPAGELPPAPAD